MRRAVVEVCVLVLALALCLFGSAGRLAWPAAWLYLVIFSGYTAAAFLVVPADLVRERAAPPGDSDRVDALLASAGFLGLYPGTLVAAGLDAGRSGASLPWVAQVLGFVVFAGGYGFALWAMHTNRFFSTFVRVQTERGHAVVSTGPYAWVRHPGYAGTIAAHAALPAALGSVWAFVPALIGGALFVVRTAREDRVLAERLPGYREYRSRVVWRLLPGVW